MLFLHFLSNSTITLTYKHIGREGNLSPGAFSRSSCRADNGGRPENERLAVYRDSSPDKGQGVQSADRKCTVADSLITTQVFLSGIAAKFC